MRTGTFYPLSRSCQFLNSQSKPSSVLFHSVSAACARYAQDGNTASTSRSNHSSDSQRSTVPSSQTSKSSTSIIVDLSSKLNPPSSTLPPPLIVPKREPNQSFLSFAYRAGRAYLTFYKTGIKAIFANRRAAAFVRQRLNSTQTPQLPPSPLQSTNLNNGSTASATPKEIENLYAKYSLTRSEFQLLARNKHDISRVPIFFILFLILGEWLPLIVIFFTPLIPYTCRIPSQVEGDRCKFETRRSRSFRGELDGNVPAPVLYATEKQELRPGLGQGQRKSVPRRLEELSKTQLMHISRSLGLHIRLWDALTRGHLPPTWLLKQKAKRRLAYLEQDDALLLRDSSASVAKAGSGWEEELKPEEVKMACEERGMDVIGREDEELRRRLVEWLEGRRKGKVLAMLLSRPNVWKDL